MYKKYIDLHYKKPPLTWHILTQLYKCNPSVMKMFSLKMTQRGRNM
jgi:hypothetical protein